MRGFFVFFEDSLSGSILGYTYPGAEFTFMQENFPNLRFFLVKRENAESVMLDAFLRLSGENLRKIPDLFAALQVINEKNAKNGPFIKKSEEYRIGETVGRALADLMVKRMAAKEKK